MSMSARHRGIYHPLCLRGFSFFLYFIKYFNYQKSPSQPSLREEREGCAGILVFIYQQLNSDESFLSIIISTIVVDINFSTCIIYLSMGKNFLSVICHWTMLH